MSERYLNLLFWPMKEHISSVNNDGWFMVFNATFSNISVKMWRSWI